jgi:pimeloyl-ACP methyl ester carboxylesterase
MNAAAPAISPAVLRGADDLPAPVSGQRHEIGSAVGRLTYYSAGPEIPGKFPPLLLIHSINAAGSAYEIKPLYEHYRRSRTVYALELPGFGHSQRGAREYSVRMMTDAVLLAVREIQEVHGRDPFDALAVSLSCEFLARAVTETPLAFRSAAPGGCPGCMRSSSSRCGAKASSGCSPAAPAFAIS